MLESHRLVPTSFCCSFLSLALTCSFPPLLSAQTAEHFFTPSEAPFITGPKEEIHRVSLPAGTADAAQALIDAARKEKPEAVLILEPAGNLEVGAAPLRLGSKMCLQLSPSAGLDSFFPPAIKGRSKRPIPATMTELVWGRLRVGGLKNFRPGVAGSI